MEFSEEETQLYMMGFGWRRRCAGWLFLETERSFLKNRLFYYYLVLFCIIQLIKSGEFHFFLFRYRKSYRTEMKNDPRGEIRRPNNACTLPKYKKKSRSRMLSLDDPQYLTVYYHSSHLARARDLASNFLGLSSLTISPRSHYYIFAAF